MKRSAVVPERPEAVAGVDLGVKTLAVVADNTGQTRYVANPRHLAGELKRLRRASRRVSRRQGPDRRTGQHPSRRWRKADAERNQVHHRVANLRGDALHKLTTGLAREYGTIVVEDLNVAGMLKNRRLARSIADAGFGEIRRQLGYKTRWGGPVAQDPSQAGRKRETVVRTPISGYGDTVTGPFGRKRTEC